MDGGVDHVASNQLYIVGRADMEANMKQEETISSSEITVSDVSTPVDTMMSVAPNTTLTVSPPNLNICATPLTPMKRPTVTGMQFGDSTPKKQNHH